MTKEIRLYRTTGGNYVEQDGSWFLLEEGLSWAELTAREDLATVLFDRIGRGGSMPAPAAESWLAPIAAQEVWAAGVTYYRSRTARMEESETTGGKSFYDLVYGAARPELFFKATPHRVVGPGAAVKIRSDSNWNVPEPELAVLLTPSGRTIGYTAGNDVSSRDIEGENPLYLPQAKVYERSCSLGPCLLVRNEPLAAETAIRLAIERAGRLVFEGETRLAEMKRTVESLVEYLFRDNTFPNGCFLLTGTGVVPDAPVTLQRGDVSRITIAGIGTLVNEVD